MAITKMMHLKQNSHLYNNLVYILNPIKTDDGLLVGGNAGTEPKEIFQVMQQTKDEFGKDFGRKAYHYVISFEKHEATDQIAYQVIDEFCREYLRDDYDYVFAIHNDQDHLHGHITFNSVSRTTGRKYAYKKGDWERSIQPITDQICKKYGLKELSYDGRRKNKTYVEHLADKKGRSTWSAILRRDIDYAISKTKSWDEFITLMKQMEYGFRFGESNKHGEYMAINIPGATKSRRDYSIGAGYTISDIKERIRNKDNNFTPYRPPKLHIARNKGIYVSNMSRSCSFSNSKMMNTGVHRMFRAVNYHSLPMGKISHSQVRKDLLSIHKLQQETKYLMINGITSRPQLINRMQYLDQEARRLIRQRKEIHLYEKASHVREYNQLIDKLNYVSEEEVESVLERLEELDSMFNYYELDHDLQSLQKELHEIRHEKRIIKRILEGNKSSVGTQKMRKEKKVKHEHEPRPYHLSSKYAPIR